MPYHTLIHTNLPMKYKATVQLSYTSTSDGAIDCDDILPAENIKMEVPAEDLNIHQYFCLFNRFLRAVGFCDYNIMQGGIQLAFNDMRDQKEMKRVADEYGLILEEDFSEQLQEEVGLAKKFDEDWALVSKTFEENEKLQSEVLDLKAKLSRLENPNNPNYTEEEMNAICAEALKS